MNLRAAVTTLRCGLAAASGAVSPADAEDGHRLLAVGYGLDDAAPRRADSPFLAVPNRVLAGEPTAEIWRSARPVRAFRRGAIEWSEDGAVIAGCLRRAPGDDLERAAREQFVDLLALLDERRCPHLLRVWNYVPRINAGEQDRERYRLFNAGRARAFGERCGAATAEVRFSASSAVGTPGEELRTVFLASASPTLHLENPHQTRAYRYPRAYGPVPPSFSRATVASSELAGAFFLSGTASVVGHETRHAGSIERQLDETLANIRTMIGEARAASGRPIPPLARFDLVKVYLRHAGHLEPVRDGLARELDTGTPTLYLEADICRADLLVEIEGVATVSPGPRDALRSSA